MNHTCQDRLATGPPLDDCLGAYFSISGKLLTADAVRQAVQVKVANSELLSGEDRFLDEKILSSLRVSGVMSHTPPDPSKRFLSLD
jgi:hypothetical protein